MKYLRRSVILLVLSASLLSCKEQPSQPNIILIMADDLGYGELSCYGSTNIHTPNIDKLAAQGIKFTDFHANGSVCSPTRAALMTGKYQQRTGVEGVITAANHRDVGLSLDEITIAEELKKLGYNCGIFGKWHLGYAKEFNPSLQGFDQFIGFVSGNVDYHSHIDQEGFFDWWSDTTFLKEKGYTTDLITNHGIDFIRKNNPKNTGKPFFLYLPHEAPHYPMQGRHDTPVRKVGSKKYIRKVEKDSVQSIYTEMIETMDEGIGALMQAINEEGLDKNTIVIFCSDNGAAANRGDNGVLRSFKASVYEGGHRVPGIIRYPDKIRAGTVSNELVMGMDFLPTLVDFAGGKPSGTNIDGISTKDLLLNGTKLPQRNLFWSFGHRLAMRKGQWKLVSIRENDKNNIELFDLEADLSEKNDLSSEYPEIVSGMLNRLEAWKKEVREGVTPVSK